MDIRKLKKGDIVKSEDNDMFTYVITKVNKFTVFMRVNTKDQLYTYNYTGIFPESLKKVTWHLIIFSL